MPLVSVIIPNFNHARYLTRRIESVLAQTFSDLEVIILDDASTDNSREVIARHLSDPRVRFVANERNSGTPFVQWNRGVTLAKGELVWIAESDDYAAPSMLERLAQPLLNDPTLGLSYCQSCHVDENDRNRGSLVGWTDDLDARRWRTGFTNDGRDECARYLVRKNTILNASAVVFRRSIYQAVGGAPTDLKQCGDWLTWAAILLRSSIRFEAEALNYFRAHDANVRSTTSAARFHREQCAVQKWILSRVKVERGVRQDVCRRTLRSLRNLQTQSNPDVGRREMLACIAASASLVARCPFFSLRIVLRRFFRAERIAQIT